MSSTKFTASVVYNSSARLPDALGLYYLAVLIAMVVASVFA